MPSNRTVPNSRPPRFAKVALVFVGFFQIRQKLYISCILNYDFISLGLQKLIVLIDFVAFVFNKLIFLYNFE